VLSLGLIGLGGLAMLVSGIMQKNNTTDNGFVTIMNDFQFMPTNHETIGMGSIFLVFSMWIYTLAVTQTFTARQTLHLRRITRVQIK
jgi:maltose/moltooligosaccharide transporter